MQNAEYIEFRIKSGIVRPHPTLPPGRGGLAKALGSVIVVVMAMAGTCFGQGTIIFSSAPPPNPPSPPIQFISPRPVIGLGTNFIPIPVGCTVPPPVSTSTEPFTIRVWDNSGGAVVSWAVSYDRVVIN